MTLALTDMLSSNSDKAAVALHEPGKKASAYAFFPGCQMAAIHPRHVTAAYEYLREHLKGGTGLMLRCCGAPAQWAARRILLKMPWLHSERIGSAWAGPSWLSPCPTCFQTLKEHVPEMGLVLLWQVLAESVEARAPGARSNGARVAVHDPCTTRHEPEMHDSIRILLARLGYSIEELPLSRDKTECCGFGGLMSAANPSLAKDVARRRASQSTADYVTYCAMCRNALAASGKRVSYILDLFFTGYSPDPGSGESTWLFRTERKQVPPETDAPQILVGDEGREMEAYENIELRISDEVATRMEERRILREDIQKAIHHAEKTGNRLHSPVSQEIAPPSGPPWLLTGWNTARKGRVSGFTTPIATAWRLWRRGDRERNGGIALRERLGLTTNGGEVLVSTSVHVRYLGTTFSIDLLKCPRCGMVMVTGDCDRADGRSGASPRG